MKSYFSRNKFLSSNIFLSVLCLLIIIFDLNISSIKAQTFAEERSSTDRKTILIIWDGAQRNHLMELYNTDQLPVLKEMVTAGGLLRTDLIINTETCLAGSGDGYDLETGPANSAIHSGYGYPTMQNQDNMYPNPIPAGYTFFERVKVAYPDIRTGMISTKNQIFWPLPALENAQPAIDYWWVQKTTNIQATTKAIDFLNLYSASPFFMTLHYRTPDEVGHAYGENSIEYTEKLIELDTQLGTIQAQLSALGIAESTTVIVTTDHGFGEGVNDHEACIDDNRDIWIASNYPDVINNFKVPVYQTGINPALFDLFGIDKNLVVPAFPSQSISTIPFAAPSPTPIPTPVPTETPFPTGSPTPTTTATPTPTPSLTPTPTPTATSKYVFVTSTNYSGNLGGLAGADDKCQTVANQAGLTGFYKAWLSDSVTSASSRLNHSTAPYMRIDGITVANNWTDLTDGVLAASISITENGSVVSGTGVWTNTRIAGAVASTTNTCSDWGSTTGQSVRGNNSATSGAWTAGSLLNCTYNLHLYCFQE